MVQIFHKAVQAWLLMAVLIQAAPTDVPHRSPRQDLSGPGSTNCTSDTRLMRREWYVFFWILDARTLIDNITGATYL